MLGSPKKYAFIIIEEKIVVKFQLLINAHEQQTMMMVDDNRKQYDMII